MTSNFKHADEEIRALKDELQRVNQQTSLALEAVGIGLWTLFPHLKRIIWDEQCQKIYGWPQAAISIDDFFARINSQDRSLLVDTMMNPPSRKTGKPSTIDYRFERPEDGQTCWIRITGRATILPSGIIDHFSGTAQDVTDEKVREGRLKKVEQRFHMALTNASVGIVILDTNSRIQLINKAFADLVGYSQEELLEEHFSAITHPDDIDENNALVQQLLRGDTSSYVFNKRYVRKDGLIVWGQVSSALIRDEEGNPDSFISIVQDITADLNAQAEQKKLLALLGASEERLRQAIELAELGTFEIDVAEGSVLLSERAKEWLGFTRQEGPTLTQVLDGIQNRNDVETALMQAMTSGVEAPLDIEFRVANQRSNQVRLYHAQGRVVKRAIEDPTLVVRGIAKDITAQRQYAQELERQVQWRTQALQQANGLVAQQADQLRFVTDSALTAIALYSIVRDDTTGDVIDLRYELINNMALRMTGRQAADLIGHTMLEVFPGMKNSAAWTHYVELAHTGIPLRYYNHYTQDGFDIWYQVQGVRQGELLVLSFLDITELKQTQLKLEALNKDLVEANDNLQQFAFVASHDLQEPLRKIQSFGTLLQEQHADRLGAGADLVQRMKLSAERMSVLIKDLLTFSRITTHQQAAVEIPLNRVINRVLEDLEMAIEESDVTLEVGTLPQVKGDESQLRQLFQNLLTNALKFRKPGRPLHVRVSASLVPVEELPIGIKMKHEATMYHLIRVEDNGIGFDEIYLDRIFQVFQRLHTKSQYAGTGIGLAIVQKVAANHNGSITATSRPGEGSTFQLYLPAV